MRFPMHPTTLKDYRIAGSHLCSAGTGGDWANGCERVALPGFDLCPWHEDWSKYLESQVMDEYTDGEWEPLVHIQQTPRPGSMRERLMAP